MIYDDDIQAMKDIVDVCVGVSLFSYEMQVNAPRPSENYAAIKCVSSVNPGFDETRIEVRNGEEVFVTRVFESSLSTFSSHVVGVNMLNSITLSSVLMFLQCSKVKALQHSTKIH